MDVVLAAMPCSRLAPQPPGSSRPKQILPHPLQPPQCRKLHPTAEDASPTVNTKLQKMRMSIRCGSSRSHLPTTRRVIPAIFTSFQHKGLLKNHTRRFTQLQVSSKRQAGSATVNGVYLLKETSDGCSSCSYALFATSSAATRVFTAKANSSCTHYSLHSVENCTQQLRMQVPQSTPNCKR